MINRFLTSFPTAKVIENGKTYEIEFNVTLNNYSQHTISMLIEFGPAFPLVAPNIKIPNLNHRLVDSTNFTLYPHAHMKLVRWNESINVADIIHDLIALFQKSITSQNIPNINTLEIKKIKIPSVFPEIEQLTLEETQALINDEEKLQMFICSLDCISEADVYIDSLSSSNEHLKMKGIELMEQVDESTSKLNNLVDRLNELRNEFNIKMRKYESINNELSPEALSKMLTAKIEEDSEKSFKISEDYLNKEIDTKTFIKEFFPVFRDMHLRKLRRQELKNN